MSEVGVAVSEVGVAVSEVSVAVKWAWLCIYITM